MSQVYKANSGSFKKGFTPWNKGKKLTRPPWNKLPIKIIKCKCCSQEFEVAINSKVKYYPGHYQLVVKNNNPAKDPKIRKKIRNSINRTYKEHPEIFETRKQTFYNQYTKDKMTSIELAIAKALKERNIPYSYNYRVRRYFVDFLVFECIVIECDGTYWHRNSKEKDAIRDKYLMDIGYAVFRLDEERILSGSEKCVEEVLFIVNECIGTDYMRMLRSKIIQNSLVS